MDFYTKEWKEYVYRSWKEALPIQYNITNSKLIYDGRFREIIKEWDFEKYYNNKKEYLALEKKLEKIFGKYEKITLLSEKKEKELYFKRIDEFIKKYKSKVLKTIELLESYNLKVDLDINDIDFELLALNKITLKTKEFYKNLKKIYFEYLSENRLLTDKNSNYLNDIDLIYNNVNAFLTDYTDYIEYRDDKYFEIINYNARIFSDLSIIKYEIMNKQIIIEIDECDNSGFRLILNNPKVITYKEGENGELVETNIELNPNKISCIYDINYELYEDISNYLQIQYCVNSDVDNFCGIINVDYHCDSIIGEEFIINEDEYLQYNGIHPNNLRELSNILSEDKYILLNETCFNKLRNSKIVSYSLDEDLLINFKYNKLEKLVSLKLVDINIKILKNNNIITKEELENILKEKFEKMRQFDNECLIENYYSNLLKNGIKFKKKNNLIEVNIQPTSDIVIIILCNKIDVFDNNLETKIGELK